MDALPRDQQDLRYFVLLLAVFVVVSLLVVSLAMYVLVVGALPRRTPALITAALAVGIGVGYIILWRCFVNVKGDTTAIVYGRYTDRYVDVLDAGLHLISLHHVVRYTIPTTPQLVEATLEVPIGGYGLLRAHVRVLIRVDARKIVSEWQSAVLRTIRERGVEAVVQGQLEDTARQHLQACDAFALRDPGALSELQRTLKDQVKAVCSDLGINVIWVRVPELQLPGQVDHLVQQAHYFERERAERLRQEQLELQIERERAEMEIALAQLRAEIAVNIERLRYELLQGVAFDVVERQLILDIGETMKRHGIRRDTAVERLIEDALLQLRRPMFGRNGAGRARPAAADEPGGTPPGADGVDNYRDLPQH